MVQLLTSDDLKLWRKLAERFGSLGAPLEVGYDRTVSRQIMPTVDTRVLDCEPGVLFGNLDLTGAAGTFVSLATVPDDRIYEITAMKVGGTTADGYYLQLSPDGTLNYNFGDFAKAEFEDNSMRLFVPPGWQVGRGATADAGDSSRTLQLAVLDFPSVKYRALGAV